MMIAKAAVVAPTAVSTQPASEPQYDGPPFASVLDEKTTAGAVTAKLPKGVKAEAFVERTNPSDKGDEHDPSEFGDTSLLLILNQIQGADTDVKKADVSQDPPSLPDEPDGTALLTPAIDTVAQPVTSDVQADPPMTASSDIRSATQAVASSNEKAAQRSLPAVAGDIDSAAGDGAAGSPAGEVATFTQSLPLREANLPPAKENLVSRRSEQVAATPELTSPVVGLASRQTEAANVSTVGVLPQVPGTPAWQQSLGHQVAWFARGGIQHAELCLHPEELGSIHIRLQLKEDQAQLHFVSASHQVRAAIEAAVPHLRTSLAESGIELEQSSIGAETSSRENDSAPSEQTPQKKISEQNAPNASALTDITTETPVRTGAYNSAVNIFA